MKNIEKEFKTYIKGGISFTVENYLKEYYEKQKEIIWNKLCLCEADINKLLQVQQSAKALQDLMREILFSRIEAKNSEEKLKKEGKL